MVTENIFTNIKPPLRASNDGTQCSEHNFKEAIGHFSALPLVDDWLKVFFEVVNVHGALPKKGVYDHNQM